MASYIPSSQDSRDVCHLSRPQDPLKPSYLSLPGEIRNQIMDLVLVPGHIYLDWHFRPRKLDGLRSGVQIMATCRQVYEEARGVYYSKNVLHLSPESIEATEKSLEMVGCFYTFNRSVSHMSMYQ